MKQSIRWLIVLILVISVLLTACGSDDGQSDDTQVYHVGILSGASIFATTIEGFKAGMADLGYEEGTTIIYDEQDAGGDSARMQEIAEQFVADGVDLIFTTTNNAALAARTATEGTDVPVVFTFVIAPVETGVVNDIRHPGGNVTGVQNPLDVSVGKRVEYLLELQPDTTHLWVPYNPQYPTSEVIVTSLQTAAPSLNIELVVTPVSSPADVIAQLDTYNASEEIPFDAVIIFPDLTVQASESWEAILAFCQEHQLPILANAQSQLDQGALFSYLADNEATGRQAARLADQILEGTPVGDLPVESADLFLTINLDAAESLGITVSDSFLLRADYIMQDEDTQSE